MINLLEALNKINIEPSAEELADVLWLFSQVSKKHSLPKSNFDNLSKQKTFDPDPQKNKPLLETKKDNLSRNNETNPQSTIFSKSSSEIASIGTKGDSINIPRVSFLPNSLQIARALRPLMRRVPSRINKVFDELKTVDQLAETGILDPVLKPALERCFNVALIVEANSSMVIWEPMISEFRLLLERQGAFQDIREFTLITDKETGSVKLYKGAKYKATHLTLTSPQELIDPSKKCLTLVISDCISLGWKNGNVGRMLSVMEKTNLITIIQVLPQRLWSGTGLRQQGIPIYLQNPSLKTPNYSLKISKINPKFAKEPHKWLKVPILTLEPELISLWSKFLSGKNKILFPGFALNLNPEMESPRYSTNISKSNSLNSNDENLIRRFVATASPIAQELASYFATTHLTVPIMRLVQHLMIPNSTQTHLAEVFLSGLIKQISSDKQSLNSNEITYNFVGDTRQLLLKRILPSQAQQVFINISNFIKDKANYLLDFQALIPNFASKEGSTINTDQLPLAIIDTSTLKKLGGNYTNFANNIEYSLQEMGVKPIYSIEIVGDRSYYEDIELVVDKLNNVQSKFKFCLSKEQNSLIPMPFTDRYNTGSIFGILRNYRNNSKQSKPYLVAVLNKELFSDKYRYLFGSHEANEGLAAISLYNHKQYTNTSKYLCYYLIRYCLSFIKPALLSHEETRGCFFDKKLNKKDILSSINSPSLCSYCLTNLKPEFDIELSQSYEKMVEVLKSISSEKSQEEIPFIQPTLNFASLAKKPDDKQYIQELIKKASQLHRIANFEEAIKLYDEAITLSESYLSSKDILFIEVLAVSTMNKGLVLNDLGYPEEALTLINKAIKYYEQDSQLNIQKIKAIINKASILTELSRHSESILSSDEGISIIKSIIKTLSLEEIELLAALLNNKGQSLNKLNHSSEALSCYNEGISLCENFNENIPTKLYDVLAFLLSNKAIIFNSMDNNIEAEQLQDKAVFYYKELINKEGEKWQPSLAQTLIGKAISLHNLNKFDQAINCYDSAFHLLTALIEKGHFQLKTNLAGILHNKAGVLKSIDDFDSAILEYNKAIEIRQELVKTQKRADVFADLASSFLAKGNLLKELEQLSEANDLYDKAEGIYSDLIENRHLSEFIPDLASVYNHKGNLLRELRETKQAISYYDKAISYYENLLQEQESQYLSKDLAKCFSDKAFTLWDIRDKEQAVLYFDKAIEIYRNLIKLPGPTRTLQKDLANTLVNKGNIQQSIVYCDEAIEYYKILLEENKEIKLIQDFIIAYNIKSKIAAGSGKFQKAIEYSDEIIKFAKNLEQDIYKNIYPQMAMILSNKASYLQTTNNPSEALNTSDEAINLYNSLLKDIPNLKTKGHLTLVYNLVTLLYRKAEILHELNRFEDSLNTYNKIPYWQKLYIQFCMQSGLNQLISFFLEPLFPHLYRQTIIKIELNYLDDLIIDIKDTFDMVKPFLLPGSIEELNWQHYAKQLNQLPRVSRDQIYSKIRSSSKELSLALGIIDPTPNPIIVGAIKEDSTVYYTQKDISRELWKKGWLVNLQLKGNKFGSGILINDQGFILTAFHNVYGNTLEEHIIEKVIPNLNGTWQEQIPHISGKNNITVQCPDKSLARKIDLIAIKAEGTSFTRSPLQIATQLPEENQSVILLYYDLNNSKHNYWREESATVGPLFYEHGFCFFSLHKVNGIDGASGGGVFTQDGKLLGIIKQTRTDTQDYIAIFLGDPRLQHLIPPTSSSNSYVDKSSTSEQPIPSITFNTPKIIDIGVSELKALIPRVEILLLTVNDWERKALLSEMTPIDGKDGILQGALDRLTYRIGMFGNYCAAYTESTMGSGGRHGATLTAKIAVDELKPKAVLLLGIAFGIDSNKQKLGDVLIAESMILLP